MMNYEVLLPFSCISPVLIYQKKLILATCPLKHGFTYRSHYDALNQSWNEDRTDRDETSQLRDRDETLKLRDTRLHKPKIRKYKNDSNTLEYGLY